VTGFVGLWVGCFLLGLDFDEGWSSNNDPDVVDGVLNAEKPLVVGEGEAETDNGTTGIEVGGIFAEAVATGAKVNEALGGSFVAVGRGVVTGTIFDAVAVRGCTELNVKGDAEVALEVLPGVLAEKEKENGAVVAEVVDGAEEVEEAAEVEAGAIASEDGDDEDEEAAEEEDKAAEEGAPKETGAAKDPKDDGVVEPVVAAEVDFVEGVAEENVKAVVEDPKVVDAEPKEKAAGAGVVLFAAVVAAVFWNAEKDGVVPALDDVVSADEEEPSGAPKEKDALGVALGVAAAGVLPKLKPVEAAVKGVG